MTYSHRQEFVRAVYQRETYTRTVSDDRAAKMTRSPLEPTHRDLQRSDAVNSPQTEDIMFHLFREA